MESYWSTRNHFNDIFSLQVRTDTHYVSFSPSGTTDSSPVFKNVTVLH